MMVGENHEPKLQRSLYGQVMLHGRSLTQLSVMTVVIELGWYRVRSPFVPMLGMRGLFIFLQKVELR